MRIWRLSAIHCSRKRYLRGKNASFTTCMVELQCETCDYGWDVIVSSFSNSESSDCFGVRFIIIENCFAGTKTPGKQKAAQIGQQIQALGMLEVVAKQQNSLILSYKHFWRSQGRLSIKLNDWGTCKNKTVARLTC